MTSTDRGGRCRIIFHAGMPKTASTAVQEALQRDYLNLLELGVLYPHSGLWEGSAAHHRLFLAVLDTEHSAHLRSPYPDLSPDLHGELASLHEEIIASGCQNVIVSSEILWNPLAFDTGILRRLREALPAYEMVVTVALRSIPSHARSGYLQRIVGPQRYTGDFELHVAENNADQVWQYSDRLADLSQVFGAECVYPYWYEEAREDPLAPLRAICEIPIKQGLAHSSAKRANTSPSWRDAVVQLKANRLSATRHGKPLSVLQRLQLSLLRRGGTIPTDPALTPIFRELQVRDCIERAAVEAAFDTRWWQSGTMSNATYGRRDESF